MKKIGNKIKRILNADQGTFSVCLQFGDGSTSTISLRKLFAKPKGLTAEILRGGMFEKCFVELGALAWPNGFELCPDALKMWSHTQHHPKKLAA